MPIAPPPQGPLHRRRAGWHTRRMRTAILAAALLGPLPAAAQTPPQSALQLSYEGSLGGIRMIHAEATLVQTPSGYTMRTAVTSVGGLAVLVHGHTDVLSQGIWQGAANAPTHVDSEGIWNGQPRRLIIDYLGDQPLIRVMIPAAPARRRAIDRASTAGTTDTLGLLVGMIRQVTLTGTCNRSTRLFDGAGVTQFDSTTGAPTIASPLLRCDFTTRKASGSLAASSAGRVGHGYALFAAPSAGLPAIPERIVFNTGWTGNAVLALTTVKPIP